MFSRMLRPAAALIAVVGVSIVTVPPAAAKARGEATAEQEAKSKPISLTRSKKARSHKANRARKAKYAAARAARKAAILEAKRAKVKAAAAREAAAREAAAREKDMPPAVANANALMPTALMTAPDARGGAAMSGPVPLEAAAADQLNTLSQSLAAPAPDDTQGKPIQLAQNEQAAPIAMPEPSSAPPPVVIKPVRSALQVVAMAPSDPWEQSSMIGKLFIAIGGLLTLASAARMLIA